MGNAMLPIHTGHGKADVIGVSSKSSEPLNGEGAQGGFLQLLLGMISSGDAPKNGTAGTESPASLNINQDLCAVASGLGEAKDGQEPASLSIHDGEITGEATAVRAGQGDSMLFENALQQQLAQMATTLSNSVEKN